MHILHVETIPLKVTEGERKKVTNKRTILQKKAPQNASISIQKFKSINANSLTNNSKWTPETRTDEHNAKEKKDYDK